MRYGLSNPNPVVTAHGGGHRDQTTGLEERGEDWQLRQIAYVFAETVPALAATPRQSLSSERPPRGGEATISRYLLACARPAD